MVCPLLFSTCFCGSFSQSLFPLPPSPTRDPIFFPLSAPGPGILEKPAGLTYPAICTFTQEMLSASLLGAELWGKHKDKRGKVGTGCAPHMPPHPGLSELWDLIPFSLCLQASCPWFQPPQPSIPGTGHSSLGLPPLWDCFQRGARRGWKAGVADKGRTGEW